MPDHVEHKPEAPPPEGERLRSERSIDEFGGFDIEVAPDRTASDLRQNRPGENLRKKILALPESPGVYMYIDRTGKVIYVGKAKRLKRRVSSYFNRIHPATRTNLLVRAIVDMRFIVVATEEDALHLEAAMIKEYQPRFNVLLKDDKSYPWIVVTNELYPRIFMTRDLGLKATYYGPYSNVASAKTVLNLIREIYPIRSCKHTLTADKINEGKYRLCLDYHIKRCAGVCRGLLDDKGYREYITRARQILRGETVELERLLKERMERLGEEWRFEEAYDAKMKYDLVKKFNSKAIIGRPAGGDVDLFAYEENDDAGYVNYMHLHEGAVVQSLNLEYRKRMSETPAEIMSLGIAEIGKRFDRRFGEVLLNVEPDVDFEGTTFTVPQRGEKRKLLDVALKNVRQYMTDKEKQAEAADPGLKVEKLMKRMQADFRLAVEPRHIECFDNSNIQGTNPVAACVVFRDGKPSRRDYRHFNIKAVEGPDDFASMKEVLYRRYSRMVTEGESLPDLVVVDGGKGQLSAAVEAFEELGIRGEVALVGIAKRLEEIYFPGDSLPLYIDKRSPSLRVVQHLRDEAHRFGITHHRNKRSKSQIVSELDSIKGIGEVTSAALMKHFRSLKRVSAASLDELTEVVGRAKAVTVWEHFRNKKGG